MQLQVFSLKVCIKFINNKIRKIGVFPADDLIVVDSIIFMHIPSGREKSTQSPCKPPFTGNTANKLPSFLQYSLGFNKIIIKGSEVFKGVKRNDDIEAFIFKR